MTKGEGHTEAKAEARTSLSLRGMSLEVRGGADAGRTVRVETPSYTIGSGASADLRLSDRAVSREHVTLMTSESGVTVRDEGSRNGSWVGTMRVHEAHLTADTLLTIGNTTLAIVLDSGVSHLPISERVRFGDALGMSPAIRHVFALLERAAPTELTILLEGESGVGKEVLAQAIHQESPRGAGPFVPVDCTAIPVALAESELFGHVRGAFTGATHDHVGLAEQANGGTLFLDELGELSLDVQGKLLRMLEAREVRPVGGRSSRKIDIRVIAATNRRLADAVQSGAFRKDLYYRLAVARAVVPPLRDRPEDILPLATVFLRRATRKADDELAHDIAAMLLSYRWPGNVRELRNVIDRHALLGLSDRGGLFDDDAGAARTALPVTPADLLALDFHQARKLTLDRFERAYLEHALEKGGGVVTRAAEIAKIARPSFHRMLDRLGIDRRGDDREE